MATRRSAEPATMGFSSSERSAPRGALPARQLRRPAVASAVPHSSQPRAGRRGGMEPPQGGGADRQTDGHRGRDGSLGHGARVARPGHSPALKGLRQPRGSFASRPGRVRLSPHGSGYKRAAETEAPFSLAAPSSLPWQGPSGVRRRELIRGCCRRGRLPGRRRPPVHTGLGSAAWVGLVLREGLLERWCRYERCRC